MTDLEKLIERVRALAGMPKSERWAGLGPEPPKPPEPPKLDPWRTMESAPQDGTHVLIVAHNMLGWAEIAIAWKHSESTWLTDDTSFAVENVHFWMPLPEMPEELR